MPTLTYTESPESNPGWSIRIETSKKSVRVLELERGSYFLATSDTEEFPSGTSVCLLSEADETEVFQLLETAKLNLNELDIPDGHEGTFCSLSIAHKNSFIGLEWITPLRASFGDLDKLVLKLHRLADFCRNK